MVAAGRMKDAAEVVVVVVVCVFFFGREKELLQGSILFGKTSSIKTGQPSDQEKSGKDEDRGVDGTKHGDPPRIDEEGVVHDDVTD